MPSGKRAKRGPGHNEGSALSALFSYDDFIRGKLVLVYQQQTCDPLLSNELEYIQFIRQAIANVKQNKHRPIDIIDNLHAGEMDEAGRFYVLDNLARVRKGIVQYKEKK